jgi:hypothetical protein
MYKVLCRVPVTQRIKFRVRRIDISSPRLAILRSGDGKTFVLCLAVKEEFGYRVATTGAAQGLQLPPPPSPYWQCNDIMCCRKRVAARLQGPRWLSPELSSVTAGSPSLSGSGVLPQFAHKQTPNTPTLFELKKMPRV